MLKFSLRITITISAKQFQECHDFMPRNVDFMLYCSGLHSIIELFASEYYRIVISSFLNATPSLSTSLTCQSFLEFCLTLSAAAFPFSLMSFWLMTSLEIPFLFPKILEWPLIFPLGRLVVFIDLMLLSVQKLKRYQWNHYLQNALHSIFLLLLPPEVLHFD